MCIYALRNRPRGRSSVSILALADSLAEGAVAKAECGLSAGCRQPQT